MKKQLVTRRHILKATRNTSFIVMAGGIVNMSLFSAWAAEKKALDENTAKTLLLLSRDMFPSKKFSDDFYMIAIDSLDAKALGDSSIKKSLIEGVKDFDKAVSGKYIETSSKKRKKILKSMETNNLFGTVKGEMVNVFYNDKRVWDKVGYEGASYEEGGYYLRGFQDADWPMPSSEASPKGWWE